MHTHTSEVGLLGCCQAWEAVNATGHEQVSVNTMRASADSEGCVA